MAFWGGFLQTFVGACDQNRRHNNIWRSSGTVAIECDVIDCIKDDLGGLWNDIALLSWNSRRLNSGLLECGRIMLDERCKTANSKLPGRIDLSSIPKSIFHSEERLEQRIRCVKVEICYMLYAELLRLGIFLGGWYVGKVVSCLRVSSFLFQST